MKKRILAIEDTQDATILIEATLGKLYELSTARNLVQARRILTQSPIDLILLDASLPDGDGFIFCNWLKTDNRYKHIPVVFSTARSEAEEQEHAMSLGAAAYIVKPLKPAVLREKIAEVLEGKQA